MFKKIVLVAVFAAAPLVMTSEAQAFRGGFRSSCHSYPSYGTNYAPVRSSGYSSYYPSYGGFGRYSGYGNRYGSGYRGGVGLSIGFGTGGGYGYPGGFGSPFGYGGYGGVGPGLSLRIR